MSAVENTEAAVLQGDGPDPTVQESWRVTDERSAEWALLRIREAYKDGRDRTVTARDFIAGHIARIAELEAFIKGEEAKTNGRVDHLKSLLIAWHKSRYDADPKHNVSIALGGGLLKSHAGRDRVEVDDDLAVVSAALAADADYGTMVPKPNKTLLLAYIKAEGEVPPGCRLIRATDDDRSWSVVL